MTNDRDPILQSLFAAAQKDLDGEAFTDRVNKKTRSQRNRILAALAGTVLVMAACIWIFAIPVQAFPQVVTNFLTTTLIDLGDGWAAWVFSPVNNIAGLLVLSLKAMRMFWKKVIAAS